MLKHWNSSRLVWFSNKIWLFCFTIICSPSIFLVLILILLAWTWIKLNSLRRNIRHLRHICLSSWHHWRRVIRISHWRIICHWLHTLVICWVNIRVIVIWLRRKGLWREHIYLGYRVNWFLSFPLFPLLSIKIHILIHQNFMIILSSSNFSH